MQLRQWMTLISHDQPVLVYFWNSCCLPWKASQSRMGEQTYFGTPHLGPVTIEIQRGCQMMSENPPPMHGALVQSRSSKDGSRWKQMEAMGGRPFEILWVWSPTGDGWNFLSHLHCWLSAAPCGTVWHAAPVTHLIQSDPKRWGAKATGMEFTIQDSTAGTSNMINLSIWSVATRCDTTNELKLLKRLATVSLWFPSCIT